MIYGELKLIHAVKQGVSGLRDKYLKNGASKNMDHVIKHANFQLYRVYPVRVIWKNG